MDITYTGPFAGVVIPALDNATVFQGGTIHVTDDMGGELVARGDFTAVQTPAPPPPATRPTSPPAAPTEPPADTTTPPTSGGTA